jgi:hypothetical protein
VHEETTAATAITRWLGIKQKVESKMADVETNMDTMTSHDNTLGEELIKVNSVISNIKSI